MTTDQTKNIPILEEATYEVPEYNQTDYEKEIIKSVFSKFRKSADSRNQNFNNFDGLNLIDYINDSFRRATTNVDIRDGIEDWQSIIHDPFTRNKVNAILGKITSVLPIADIVPRGDEDIRKGIILTNLYEYSQDISDDEDFMVTFLYEAIVKGTAVAYEGFDIKTQKVRNVKNVGDDITVEESIKKTSKLFSKVVKLEDFYPSSVGVRKIADMPYCFWRSVLPLEQFRQDFAMYSKTQYVAGNSTMYSDEEAKPWYSDYVSSDVPEGQVEIIRYYNKDVDEFVIIANGVWLNPIIIKGEEIISPIPFNHKELPFFDIKFELIDGDFFYGKSLPDKIKNLQDVLNVLTNMLLDQSFLTIFPPILTNGIDSIEDDYLRPGRRTPIDTQGLPINSAMMKLDLGTPSGWHQYILDYTRRVMEEATVDKVSQGVAGQGDRTTAQEIRVAAEGVSAMLGLFGRWVRNGRKRQASLRVKNIMQFWTNSDSPIMQGVMGSGSIKEFEKAFNVIKSSNGVMSNGKRGQSIIAMFADKNDLPTKKDLEERSLITEAQNGKRVEYNAILSDYIRDVDFDIKFVPNTKSDTNKETEKALQLEKVRVYQTFFPDMINREELLAQTAEKMGDDPTKVIKAEIVNQIVAPGQDKQMLDKGINPNPEGNVAQNLVGGMMGGRNELQSIASSMLG